MQPPPRSSPGAGGAACPPPSGGAPNAYRRNSPFRRSNTPMSAPPASVPPPVNDPLGHGRLRPPPGNGHSGQSTALPNPAKAGPLPPGQVPPVFPVPFPNRQDGNWLPHEFTNALHSAPALFPGQSNAAESGGPPYEPNSLVAPLPIMPQFNSGSHFSPAPQAHNAEAGHNLAPELSYFHTGAGLENSYAGLPMGPAPFQNRTPYAQEPSRDPMAYLPPASGQPAFPQQNSAQWAPAQGSRPPSVQNYFQPSDPQTQSFNSYSVPQPHPPSSSPAHLPSPHNLMPAERHQPPSQEPFVPAVVAADASGHRLPGFYSGPQPPEAFIQQEHHRLNPNLGSAEAWLSGPRNEPYQLPAAAEAGYQSNTVGWGERLEDPQHLAAQPVESLLPVDTESGTVSMFFKGDEVENEETLRTERTGSSAVDSFQPSSVPFFNPYPQPNPAQPNILTQRQPSQAPPAEQPSFLPNPAGQYGIYVPGCAELGANPNAGGSRSQRDERLQFENNENLDFIQNQEVLPSEPDRAQIREHVAQFQPIPGLGSQMQPAGESREGVPNLEKLNSAPHPRPLRSDSIASNHSSGSSSRRSLPPAPPPSSTFIQQESGKEAPDSSAHFFEQIDSSPQGGEGLYHTQTSQPPTPSPPKPTGTFQASANSSFEPVRSHGQLAFKPPEVDQAKMVMELNQERLPGPPRPAGHLDVSPGNLEQPPDNLENLFLPQPCLELGGAEQLVQAQPPPQAGPETPEKRPSSRVSNVRVKCDSPAATLWAQSELPSFCGGIILAPAAPAVHVAMREPGAEGSRQREGNPESLSQRFQGPALGIPGPGPHPGSENLENPPLVVEDLALKSQASSSYATLLVPSATEILPSQPVLLAQPLQSHTSTLASPSAPTPSQPLRNQVEGEKVSGSIPSSLGIGAVLPVSQGPLTNPIQQPPHPPPHLNPTHNLVRTSGVLPQTPSPLNLTADTRASIRLPAEGLPEPPPSSPPLSQAPGPGRSVAVAASNYQFAPGKNATNQPYSRPEASVNCELLDFTVPRTLPNEPSASTNATDVLSLPSTAVIAPQPVVPHSYPQGVQANDKPGFYLQVTKDVQQSPIAVTGQHTAPPPSAQPTTTDAGQPVPAGSLLPTAGYGPPGSGLPQTVPQPPTQAQVPPANVARPPSQSEMQQPPPSRTPQQVYSAPQQPGYNYGYNYPDYSVDTRQPYPGSYPVYPPQDARGGQQMQYPAVDNRVSHQYNQEDQYRMYDPRYPRYDQGIAGYKEAERSQYTDQERERPSRPSSRASQCSDRPSSRQGYPEDYYSWRNGQAGYAAYYADYYRRQQDYGDPNHWERYDPAVYDPRYQQYWYYNNYRRGEPYYLDPYAGRRNGYESQWQYDPRYDASFDDEYDRPRELYQDEFDRRSVHSEHSLPSSHSTRSRRSSFSAHSQQSQVYKSQQDLTAPREAPGQPAPVDYTYAVIQDYQDNAATMQGYPEYQYGYPAETGWQPVEKAPPRPVTPEKFMVPHMCARFSPGGQLLKVLPNLPSEGQPALVELHSLEIMFQHLPEQEELRNFPGPLVKEETHKIDVINFAQNKGTECLRNEKLLDKESASLLWDLMVLLCRQNGTVIGTDIAELLLREHRSVWLPGKSPNEANLIDFNNELAPQAEDESCTTQLSLLTDSFIEGTSASSENSSKETERFRELLLFGRKKDALESAMKHGLWGHALLLASKMDNRTHAKVMTRFANSLPINDPLQTVYQLMSGRMPAAATCCGEEKWGHWRPHLAMVLSNLSNGLELNRRTITTMGDTLATKGLLEAAHFCYLMAQVGFGVYTRKSTKLVLIGSNHSWSFMKFASAEAIQRTETYEYAQSLGSQPCFLPNFQVFKFIYACRLAEMGLTAQAFHYCEVIAKTMMKNALFYSPVLYSQLLQVSSQLRFFDPQLREKSEQELNMEPEWMVHLKLLDQQMKEGTFHYSSERAATPHQYGSSTPSSEYDHGSQPDGTAAGLPEGVTGSENPLMTSFVPSAGGPSVQLMPPAPQATLDGTTVAPVPQLPAAPPPQMTVDGNIPMYFPLQPSAAPPVPGFPGQSLNSAFRQPYEPEKEPLYMGTAGPPPPGLPAEPLQTVPEQVVNPGFKPNTQISPKRQSFSEAGQIDFYDHMAKMAPGRRSRSTSQSSLHMPYGRRSRTTSESSTHSGGRERRSSLVRQPSLPSQDSGARAPEVKEPRREAETKKSKGGWLSWLRPNRKPEAHLPDDKNKSIVWDEKQQRWVNLNEPAEEESKPPPPPPSFPKPQSLPMAGPPGGPPSVNMFSKKAGTRARYVDVLNPSGTRPGANVPPPIDLFAPLAPMAIPANLFMPAPGEGQPNPDTSTVDSGQPADNTNLGVNTQPLPNPGTDGSTPVPDGLQLGEVPGQSMQGAPPMGAVQFYNPAQFSQPPATGSKPGRFGQRKYPTLK